MNPYQDILLRQAAECRSLRGSECRLLVYLTARVIESGSLDIEASETMLAAAVGLGHSQVTNGKRRLHTLGLVIHTPGNRTHARDRYHLAYLRGHQLPLFQGQATPVSGAGAPVSGAVSTPVSGAATPVSGAGAPVSGAADGHGPGQGQDPRASNRIESGVSIETPSDSIDRILTTQEIPNDQRPAAETLRAHLLGFIQEHGTRELKQKPVDDVLIAQCLAIAELDVLIYRLRELHKSDPRDIGAFSWFVTALIDRCLGYSPHLVKQRRAALRARRKPPISESNSPGLRDDLVAQLNRGVRSIR